MNAILITLNIIVLAALGVLSYEWPPALFALVIVVPFSLLSLWGVSTGGLSARSIFVTTAALVIGGIAIASFYAPIALYGAVVAGPIVLLGVVDMLQTKRAIRRNFPVIGHARYILETIRPEIQQYFIETDIEGRPFNREDRSLVYARSKHALDSLPFGTQRDVYETGYEWINHSMQPVEPEDMHPRVLIGEGRCEKPYLASIFNISAMSFGPRRSPTSAA